jgi:Ca2+-binding EF-hand superfamily protein
MSPSILTALKKRLVSETKMEGEEIEALWDQFTCLAASEWDSDPNGIGWALDRRGFSQAFIPRYSTFIAAPNLVYDRIFSYYDSDHNGKIGFEEFVKGLDGMHSRDPKRKFRIVFNGYDIDGDGYISRKDVLRIFRAYYAVEKEATRNFLAEQSEELSARGALEAIHSSQPLGATFTHQAIHRPFSPTDRLEEKTSDQDVNLTPVLRDDTDDTVGRADILRDTQPRRLARNFGIGDEEQEEEAIRERWTRRQFYVDEEEGLARPEGVEELPPIYQDYEHPEEEEAPPTLEQELPRGSRSSSRVRFQDDIDEIRSNASTSSRPFGERWGGYEIPEPEKDFGKEVLYQITQQAFNELLDPLFKEKEDNAMDAHATRVERRKLASLIEEATADFKDEEDMNKTIILVGMFTYTKYLMRAIEQSSTEILKRVFESAKDSPKEHSDAKDELEIIFTNAERLGVGNPQPWPPNWQPTAQDLWNAKLCRLQLQHEWVAAVLWQLEKVGWVYHPTPSKHLKQDAAPLQEDTEGNHQKSKTQTGIPSSDAQLPYRDPTMPQFRPNSLADVQSSSSFEDSSESDSDDTSTSESSEILRTTHPHTAPFSNSIFIIPIGSQASSVTTSEPQSPSSTTANTITMQIDDLASNLIHIPLPPPPPPPLPPTNSTAPFNPNNEPVIFWIDINTSEFSLEATPLPEYRLDYQKEKQLQRMLISKIRRRAMCENSALHIPMLASLVEVEKEIIERKGSGLVNYEEFEEKMVEENLRFMESWMEWVSF